MGKRKIVIEEIKGDRQKRSVTFTKRRDGLFKKAQTACQKFGGLQIGIVVFSPAGKPFTFCNSSSSSSVSSVDEIIDTYISSTGSSTSTSSSSAVVVMGKRRSRSDDDDDDVQVIETEKKKKQKTVNAVVTPPPSCITVEEEEEEEKLDEGFHWDDDHYYKKNVDSDQTHHDLELRSNEFSSMGYGENAGIIVTEEMINMESSQFLVEGSSSSHSWVPPDVVELQEIINVEDDDDFEYADNRHHHCDKEETTPMGLLPPSHTPTTTATTMGFCDLLLSASDTNDDEEEDYGCTFEEWEHIFSTSPTVVVDTSSYLNQEEEEVPADNWPTQEFVQLLCS